MLIIPNDGRRYDRQMPTHSGQLMVKVQKKFFEEPVSHPIDIGSTESSSRYSNKSKFKSLETPTIRKGTKIELFKIWTFNKFLIEPMSNTQQMFIQFSQKNTSRQLYIASHSS